MWFVVFGLFFIIVIIFGNFMVVYLVIMKFWLYNISNWFVVFFVLVDLFVGLIYFLGICVLRFGKEFFINYIGVWFKVSYIFVYLLFVNLCVLIVDRYIVIMMFLKYIIFMLLC